MAKHVNAARKRSSRKKLNLAIMLFNCVFFVALGLFFLYGLFNIMSPKKSIRNAGLKEFEAGNYEEALKKFDEALAEKQWFSDKIDVDLELYRADCFVRLDRFDEAKATYEHIKADYDQKYWEDKEIDFLIEINANVNKFYHGDYVSTVACFLDAIEKGHTEMCLYLAICYQKQGDSEKMKEYFDRYIAEYGMSSFLYFEYGEYYISTGDLDAALTCIEQGITSADQTYIQQLLYEQVYCYKEKCEYETAYRLAAEYVGKYPEDQKGQDLYNFLDTRVNITNTTPLNDIYDLGNTQDSDY